jgi:hypothetical protein
MDRTVSVLVGVVVPLSVAFLSVATSSLAMAVVVALESEESMSKRREKARVGVTWSLVPLCVTVYCLPDPLFVLPLLVPVLLFESLLDIIVDRRC